MPQEHVHVYRRRKSKKAAVAGIDALPDEALQHVLSFLPSREAVRTCVLARRWRHLWRSMPTLRISSSDYAEQESRFVANLLVLHDGTAPLNLCEFSISVDDCSVNEPLVRSWTQQALRCRAQIVRVDHADRYGITLKLCYLHLISQHLTTLELDNVCIISDDFSSLLALKNLQMTNCEVVSEKISSPSLKQLAMIECDFWSPNRVQISAPSVVLLELTDNDDKTPLLGSMPSLVKAFVRLHGSDDCCSKEEFGGLCSNNSCDNCADNSNAIADCVLLKVLSKAESLELVAEPGMFIFKKDLTWCPVFSNLKTLLLNEWCVAIDFCTLICFLQHAPILEKLTLQLAKAPRNWVLEGSCNPSQQHFPSKKLKIVEVKCEKFDKRVSKIFVLLTVYAVCIEQFNIQRTSRDSECYSFQKNSDLPW